MSEPWADREGHDREVPSGSWPVDTETPAGREVYDDREAENDGEDRETVELPAVIAGTRPMREPWRTCGENLARTKRIVRQMPPGRWQQANLAYVSTIGALIEILCRTFKWAFVDGALNRAIPAALVLAALLFVANQIPATQWFIPNQLDVSWYLPQTPVDPPGMVEVPIPDGQR